MAKVSKGAFLEKVAERSGVPDDVVSAVYHTMISEIEDIMRSNEKLCLTGFGTFSLQRHKGHPVQFETEEPVVSDYVVFKFSASNVMNRKFREWDAKQRGVSLGLPKLEQNE